MFKALRELPFSNPSFWCILCIHVSFRVWGKFRWLVTGPKIQRELQKDLHQGVQNPTCQLQINSSGRSSLNLRHEWPLQNDERWTLPNRIPMMGSLNWICNCNTSRFASSTSCQISRVQIMSLDGQGSVHAKSAKIQDPDKECVYT